jgi:hypothetical protein
MKVLHIRRIYLLITCNVQQDATVYYSQICYMCLEKLPAERLKMMFNEGISKFQ